MDNTGFLEKVITHFYENEDKLREAFSEPEIRRILRLRDFYNEMLRNPLQSDGERIVWLKNRHGLKDRQAYKDLADIRAITGVISINREALRYEMTQLLQKNIQAASEAGDFRAVASLVKELKSINRLDKNDPERIDPSKLYPEPTAPTCDVTVLGLPASRPGLAEEMRRKYGKRQAEDVEYTDVPPPTDPITETPTRLEKKQKESLQPV
ncbi:MAG: hypothetical protein LBQ39_01955 [Tannerellaceae bacterium]|jgi:hypothetical protein|nr:hypothetical protein [Tannerellaceae bacterium]